FSKSAICAFTCSITLGKQAVKGCLFCFLSSKQARFSVFIALMLARSSSLRIPFLTSRVNIGNGFLFLFFFASAGGPAKGKAVRQEKGTRERCIERLQCESRAASQPRRSCSCNGHSLLPPVVGRARQSDPVKPLDDSVPVNPSAYSRKKRSKNDFL